MSNGSESMDKKFDELSFDEQLKVLQSVAGVQGAEVADEEESYAIFTDGPLSDREFKRVPKPSYNKRIAVEEVRIKAKAICLARDEEKASQIKHAICQELGWDPEEKISNEHARITYHKKLIPLLVREDLPEEWDVGDSSSLEVERMLNDFLLST